MSESIIGRIDEMGTRIDDLERSIADLVKEADGESELAANAGAGGAPIGQQQRMQ